MEMTTTDEITQTNSSTSPQTTSCPSGGTPTRMFCLETKKEALFYFCNEKFLFEV